MTCELQRSERQLQVSLVCLETNPAFALIQRPLHKSGTVAASAADTRIVKLGRPSYLDVQSTSHTFTLTEPLSLGSSATATLCTTYLVDIPRTATLSHSAASSTPACQSRASSISILGLHLLSSHSTRTSTLNLTAGQHLADLSQNFVELAALAKARRPASDGHLPIHVLDVGWAAAALAML